LVAIMLAKGSPHPMAILAAVEAGGGIGWAAVPPPEVPAPLTAHFFDNHRKHVFATYNSSVARIGKEAFDSAKHSGLPDGSPDAIEPLRRHCTAPTLIPHTVVFGSVCSFTFQFYSRQQLERVLDYYEQKIVPSSREPESVWSLWGGDHSEAERWFERMPPFLA
jgi:hypothetical protein